MHEVDNINSLVFRLTLDRLCKVRDISVRLNFITPRKYGPYINLSKFKNREPRSIHNKALPFTNTNVISTLKYTYITSLETKWRKDIYNQIMEEIYVDSWIYKIKKFFRFVFSFGRKRY